MSAPWAWIEGAGWALRPGGTSQPPWEALSTAVDGQHSSAQAATPVFPHGSNPAQRAPAPAGLMDSILAASRYRPSASVTRPVRLQSRGHEGRVKSGWVSVYGTQRSVGEARGASRYTPAASVTRPVRLHKREGR